MAAAFLTLGEGFLAERAQSVSYSPVHHRYTIHNRCIHPDSMVYNTGSRDDWDHVSRITGDPAWAWDAMTHYRDLNQKYVPPNDGHDDVSQKQMPAPHLFLPSAPDKSVSPFCTQS